MRRFPLARPCVLLALACALILSTGCASQAPRAEMPAAGIPVQTTSEQAVPEQEDAVAPDRAFNASAPVAAKPGETEDGQATAPAETQGMAQAGDPRTQAEQDFDVLYGMPYDPVADPTLPSPATMPSSYDPWEPLNRRVHAFNNAVDVTIATPLARAYVAAVPRPVRLGVSNFFNNLGQPASAINALLQGKPAQAGASLGRFLVNATVGVAGFLDPATRFSIPNRSEDFGQTLGVWGWKTSRYVELPLFGPRTVRDVFGLVGDAPLSTVRQLDHAETRYFLQGLQLVDLRTQLFALDSMREGATDEYALFRDAWLQRRSYQIFGDRIREGDDALPDYLREDQTTPIVPVDVMPLVPGSGN